MLRAALRRRRDVGTDPGEAIAHRLIVESFGKRRIQFLDHRFRRSSWGKQCVPSRELEIRETSFYRSGNVWDRGIARRRSNRKGLDAA